jgi:hypothetical protein
LSRGDYKKKEAWWKITYYQFVLIGSIKIPTNEKLCGKYSERLFSEIY